MSRFNFEMSPFLEHVKQQCVVTALYAVIDLWAEISVTAVVLCLNDTHFVIHLFCFEDFYIPISI